MDLVLSLYACIFCVGVVGNGSLGLALCCGPGVRSRSPLLLGLIAADLVVCAISGPVSAALYAIEVWSQACKRFALFFQAWPISASTLSMMAISIDRFLTVKNYQPAVHIVRRHNMLAGAVVFIWLVAAVLATPCVVSQYPGRKTLIMVVAVLVHIIPAVAVMISHIGVHAKLTALSLTARAKHGELPLPMPLLRRPTHVIIVAGIPKAESGLPIPADEEEGEDEEQGPPTSTLRSRRRLANSLLLMAIFFAVFWLPHVVCEFCESLDAPLSPEIQRYCLILGHIHSALSPVLYWILNHQWLHRPCQFRFPTLYRSASSTNEANLGPFHPRLVRPPPVRRCSSHYLY